LPGCFERGASFQIVWKRNPTKTVDVLAPNMIAAKFAKSPSGDFIKDCIAFVT
jgi:hypothetical protein